MKEDTVTARESENVLTETRVNVKCPDTHQV